MHKERAAKIGRKKRKFQLIAIGVIAAVAIGIGFGVYNYMQNPPRTANFGPIGSAHEHAALKLFINNEEPIDFSEPRYQVQSRFIHFEDRNGVVVHRHATNVDLGFFFQSLDMEFNDQCIKLVDGTSYCNDGENTLKMYVNGARNNMYDEYVLKDGDRILITYGDETEEEIQSQLNTLSLIQLP